jgi:hypothetical protein
MKIVGYLLILWGLADIGLNWTGTDVYYEIGIIIPGVINPFTGIIAMVIGGGLTFGGDYDEGEIDPDIAQINKNKFNKNIQQKKREFSTEVLDNHIKDIQREFSQKDIQEVLDTYITEWGEGACFVFSITESDNIYVQGYLNANYCHLEISSRKTLDNPAILDTHKYKQLILLGWGIPNDDCYNFSCEATLKDVLEDKVAKLLFESLKVFDIPDDKINVTHKLYLI